MAKLVMVWENSAAVALTSNEGPSQHWLLAEKTADLLAAENTKTEFRKRKARRHIICY